MKTKTAFTTTPVIPRSVISRYDNTAYDNTASTFMLTQINEAAAYLKMWAEFDVLGRNLSRELRDDAAKGEATTAEESPLFSAWALLFDEGNLEFLLDVAGGLEPANAQRAADKIREDVGVWVDGAFSNHLRIRTEWAEIAAESRLELEQMDMSLVL